MHACTLHQYSLHNKSMSMHMHTCTHMLVVSGTLLLANPKLQLLEIEDNTMYDCAQCISTMSLYLSHSLYFTSQHTHNVSSLTFSLYTLFACVWVACALFCRCSTIHTSASLNATTPMLHEQKKKAILAEARLYNKHTS